MRRSTRLRKMKVRDLRPAPVLTEEERVGVDLLDRVWLRLQLHGRYRDGLSKGAVKTREKCIPGDVLWDTMMLVSKIRGRLRAGKYRPEGFKMPRPKSRGVAARQRKLVLEGV